MIKIDKEDSEDDSDRALNKSMTTTPRKGDQIPSDGNNDSIHINHVNNVVITNVDVPPHVLPKVCISTNFFSKIFI